MKQYKKASSAAAQSPSGNAHDLFSDNIKLRNNVEQLQVRNTARMLCMGI